MWRAEELAGAGGSAAMRWLRAPELSDSGDDLPGHSQTADALVSGDVGCHEPEERCQCHRDPEGVGLGQLRYGLDLAAQIAEPWCDRVGIASRDRWKSTRPSGAAKRKGCA